MAAPDHSNYRSDAKSATNKHDADSLTDDAIHAAASVTVTAHALLRYLCLIIFSSTEKCSQRSNTSVGISSTSSSTSHASSGTAYRSTSGVTGCGTNSTSNGTSSACGGTKSSFITILVTLTVVLVVLVVLIVVLILLVVKANKNENFREN
ncbi:unnamed protein product [Ceratitis capitata]|uniref:(Mediterranean fruit fly) hypothetical protein n=1 Tax=Ceratitis capitata TaxID=7213 RepID=A0A811UJ67_CERCA|nr:unnamed protein product [Ceratitis capitata]